MLPGFTGYVFPTAASILPFVERPGASLSTEACAEIAQRLGCYVIAGYPAPTLSIRQSKEQVEGDSASAADGDKGEPAGEGVARNNAIVVDPNGKVIHEYTKTNMFESDLPWAQPGGLSGF